MRRHDAVTPCISSKWRKMHLRGSGVPNHPSRWTSSSVPRQHPRRYLVGDRRSGGRDRFALLSRASDALVYARVSRGGATLLRHRARNALIFRPAAGRRPRRGERGRQASRRHLRSGQVPGRRGRLGPARRRRCARCLLSVARRIRGAHRQTLRRRTQFCSTRAWRSRGGSESRWR